MIRRVVLGDAARDDHEISDLLTRLRRESNWSFLAPRRNTVYADFHRRLSDYLSRAEPGSLAERIARAPTDPDTHPEDQVPHWLFTFEPAGLATIRALALLATHPERLREVREELRWVDLTTPQRLPRLRAAVLESARLWPTTPAVLRAMTTETEWPSGTLPPAPVC